MKYLTQISKKDLFGEICLLRADFNLKSMDDIFRIAASLPTLKFLLKRRAKVLILSHRGRPTKFKNQNSKIKIGNDEKEFSLRPIGKILSKKLGRKVNFLPFDTSTAQKRRSVSTLSVAERVDFLKIKKQLDQSRTGSVFLMENLRFLGGEDKNDAVLAKKLAGLGTFYVNDAFAVSHRRAASVVAITKFIKSYAGLLMEKEIKNLSRIMIHPKKPLVIILGGSKIGDKIAVINNLWKKTNYFLFGSSILNGVDGLGKLLNSEKVLIPTDGKQINGEYFDIGRGTIDKYAGVIKKARSIIWNGPLGIIEQEKYSIGSNIIAKAIAGSRAFTVAGGGETTNLILKLKLDKKIKFLSTGGGAMLDFLAGKKLPGVEALK